MIYKRQHVISIISNDVIDDINDITGLKVGGLNRYRWKKSFKKFFFKVKK